MNCIVNYLRLYLLLTPVSSTHLGYPKDLWGHDHLVACCVPFHPIENSIHHHLLLSIWVALYCLHWRAGKERRGNKRPYFWWIGACILTWLWLWNIIFWFTKLCRVIKVHPVYMEYWGVLHQKAIIIKNVAIYNDIYKKCLKCFLCIKTLILTNEFYIKKSFLLPVFITEMHWLVEQQIKTNAFFFRCNYPLITFLNFYYK